MKSYLEGVTGRARKMPGKVREKAGRMRTSQGKEPQSMPARPDLRNNFMGRLRASIDWFFRLPRLRRRTILLGAVVPAVIAFLISMGAVTGLELAIGNSLPCGIWKNCPVAANGSQVTSTSPSLLLGQPKAVNTTQDQQSPASQQQTPGQQNAQPGANPNAQPAAPGAQPANPQQPATPNSGTPNSGTPSPGTPGSGTPDAGNPQAAPTPAPPNQAAPPAQGSPAPSQ